ncbi:MAG: LysM peptidoglycan-binding domain-containing protein [Cyanobacteria bacterium SZAS LIN-2]|nr:LysM peptidoglycan-binding domain-containing protein [Cyanobacteria bacterium SZAS LIN-3]MBS1996047.1 LysM peptidoglycan-binding domain-containing protein [Cyanobacteria bacterium SZAS LIN-2]
MSISTRSLAEREAQRTMSGVLSTGSHERQYTRDSQRDTGGFNRVTAEVEAPRTDELEALWPGVHQDFLHSPKRTPSFYMMLGFMGGAFVSMFVIWGFAGVSSLMHGNGAPQTASAAHTQAAQPVATPVAAVPQGGDQGAMLVPAHSSVTIQTGDTLAAVALREYKRVSPRLLDEICKNNGLKNANFLNLGQKINLPNYTPQATQMAVTPQGQVH